MKKQSKIGMVAIAGCLAAVLLAGCNNSASSSGALPPSQGGASSSSGVQPGTSVPDSGPAAARASAILDTILGGANLGATIDINEIDLAAAYGLTREDIVDFSGASSKMVSQHGGEVLVLQAAPGRADALKGELEAYRDGIANDDRYADFQDARDNVKQARIEVYGDYVVYAVSATGLEGGYAELDTAIEAAFANG